jgi:hypothetical protein
MKPATTIFFILTGLIVLYLVAKAFGVGASGGYGGGGGGGDSIIDAITGAIDGITGGGDSGASMSFGHLAPGVHSRAVAVTPTGNAYVAVSGSVTQPYIPSVNNTANGYVQTYTAPPMIQGLVAPGSALPAPAPNIGLAPRAIRL